VCDVVVSVFLFIYLFFFNNCVQALHESGPNLRGI